MKKILLFLCLSLSLSVLSAWASSETNKPVEIKKGEMKEENKVLPRTLELSLIKCHYNNASLYFTFLEDFGEIEISVSNQETGAITTSEYDSTCNSLVMNVSTESGNYLIEITTENGEYYYGEYSL